MDDSEKATIRRIARRRIWAISIGLFLYCGVLAFLRLYFVGLGSNYSKVSLSYKATLFNAEFTRFSMNRGRLLMAFPPPARESSYSSWAEAIRITLGQETAVFWKNADSLAWINVPSGFRNAIKLAETSFHSDSVRGNRNHPDLIGAMETSHWSVGPGEDTDYQMWMLGRVADQTRWGVLLRKADTWQAFFKQFNESSEIQNDPNNSAWTLSNMFALPSSPTARWLTGVRAVQNGTVLFASPGLDTNRISYKQQQKEQPLIEFYQSRLDELYAREIDHPRIPWGAILVPLLLIIPLVRSYRQVRQLTAGGK